MTDRISGGAFKQMVAFGAACIAQQKQAINDLNVFPVPDGDTGTNMSLTIQTAVTELRRVQPATVEEASKVTASGLLRGARGNSGVILSLLFRGMSKVFKGLNEADGAQLAAAMQEGVSTAYGAVMKPAEGTVLTVSRLAAQRALEAAGEQNDAAYVLEEAIKTGYTTPAGRCVISEATGDGLDLLGIVCGAATTILESGDLLMESFTECANLFDYAFDNYSYLTLLTPLYPVDQVKINNSAGAEAVAVAPQDEIKVLLPNDYDPAQLVTDIQLNSDSVDAPVREGDVLGSATVTYAGEVLGQTKLLAITDVARSEISSAATGTGAYIQKNWWKWVVIAIFAAIGVILVLILLYQLRKRRYRRMRMEQRRRALEDRRRRFREGYDLPFDELERK